MNGRPKSLGTKADIRVAVAGETDRAIALARRVGKRLRGELDKNAGKIPDESWIESAKWYSRTVAELGRLVAGEIGKSGKPGTHGELSDSQYAEELRLIAVQQLRSASPEERDQLLAEAGIKPGTSSADGIDPAHRRDFS